MSQMIRAAQRSRGARNLKNKGKRKCQTFPTPHIEAKSRRFRRDCPHAHDPLRARFITETFLKDPVLVNNVRGIQGYTGTYEGKRVSVMASGMGGMPSMAIYSYELFNFYDVKNIIRVGTAGVVDPSLKVRDIVIGMGAAPIPIMPHSSTCQAHMRLSLFIRTDEKGHRCGGQDGNRDQVWATSIHQTHLR